MWYRMWSGGAGAAAATNEGGCRNISRDISKGLWWPFSESSIMRAVQPGRHYSVINSRAALGTNWGFNFLRLDAWFIPASGICLG